MTAKMQGRPHLPPCITLPQSLKAAHRVISSAVERFVHIEDVSGANPLSPTIISKALSVVYQPLSAFFIGFPTSCHHFRRCQRSPRGHSVSWPTVTGLRRNCVTGKPQG